MSFGKFLKLFVYKSYIKKLYRYSSSALGFKMVRYFPNTMSDYAPGTEVSIPTADLNQQIEEHINNIEKRLPPTPNHADGGLYVGIAGVAYMFYHLSKNAKLIDKKQIYLQKSLEYLKTALENPTGERTSFLLGDAGTYAIASVIKKSLGDPNYVDSITSYRSLFGYYIDEKFLKCGGDEYFVGRAGYIAGALWMTSEMRVGVLSKAEIYRLCDTIVESGRDYAEEHDSPCPLMFHYYNTEYLGAAHGLSFILQMLITVPGYLQMHISAARDIKASIDFLLSLQTVDGNFPSCLEELDQKEHRLVHWCHGAPGTVYLMAKAFLVYRDRKYLKACMQAAEVVWNKGLLMKGPGLCHGVAGSGYVFLLLYRLTSDQKYLYRAKAFAEFMRSDQFLSEARVPDNPETLFEGTAGTVCYLADILQPHRAQFPFQDIFQTYD